nr:hypothetical protein [Streptomyces sp. S1D4-11]QIY93088.1 hypothetical protein HEP87_01210 [Streptomyces sp. S1D4-11]
MYDKPRTVRKRYRAALVGGSARCTWGRLYLGRKETAALAVLIVAELGLNVTTLSEIPVPESLPGTAEAGMPVYRLQLEKRRRAGYRGRFESRNVTDSGADSSGRIITGALEATAHARALLKQLDGDVDRLPIWRQTTPHDAQAYPNAVRIGPFGFGVDEMADGAWARSVDLTGSPLRRMRKTVNVLHRREPGQNTQDTYDSIYVVGEPQAQQAAVSINADEVWSLAPLIANPSAARPGLDWARFPDAVRSQVQLAAWMMINTPLPASVLVGHPSWHSRLGPTGIYHTVLRWQRFTVWLRQKGLGGLHAVTEDVLVSWAGHLARQPGASRGNVTEDLVALTRLWAFDAAGPPRTGLRAADAEEIAQLKGDVEALVGALHQSMMENRLLHQQLSAGAGVVRVLPHPRIEDTPHPGPPDLNAGS